MDYRQSGVDIAAADALVNAIKPVAKATHRLGALGMIGGFGALFDPKAAGFSDPILVTSTDGVGTKLLLAIETGIHDTIGIDLVAMCVNDLIVQGAEPLSFLDYFATGKLDPDVAKRVIHGIANGCVQAGCVLAGGETAEMPGMYPEGHYDLAGFALGAAERGTLLPANVEIGDFIFGLESSGAHSNGFSLIRNIVGQRWNQPAPFDGRQTLAQAFLRPTKIYVKTIMALHKNGLLKAAAHITGGGIIDNLPRVLPDGMSATLCSWPIPDMFFWLKQEGNVSDDEMLHVLNCGIGMVIIIKPEHASRVTEIVRKNGDEMFFAGQVTSSPNNHKPVFLSNPWMDF
jgi:phosphoribosylformylglycinamidine cyclo-ligase